MSILYFTAPSIFDGERVLVSAALAVANGCVAGIVPTLDVPDQADVTHLQQGMIAPGFVDLQVNGGGGVMLNDSPDLATIQTICAAHRKFGTTSLLPTLITDTPQKTGEAIAAGIEATKRGVEGFRGLHLEGPHLARSRQGAHDPALIRPMLEEDLAALIEARSGLETLVTTLAPESVTLEQVRRLVAAGVVVSLGHTDTDYARALEYFAAGASMVTHLFNAMSQMGNREPGLVGGLLDQESVYSGLIADGFHVHPASMAAALRAKRGPGRIFLVTDAMSTVGSDIRSFFLNGREIRRQGGRLTLADGTLAGADVDMMTCVRLIQEKVGVETVEALRMASLYPAESIGRANEIGSLKAGARADFVHLSDRLELVRTYCGGG